MVGFCSLFELRIPEEGKEVFGKIQSFQIGVDNPAAIFRSRGVGKRGTGTDDMQHVLRDVGDKQSVLRGFLSGDRKPPSLNLREVVAESVHLRNWKAGLNQGSIELGRLFDRDAAIESFLDHRRRPTADKKKNQTTIVAGGKQLQNGLRCIDGDLTWQRMASREKSNSAVFLLWHCCSNDNRLDRLTSLQSRFKPGPQRVPHRRCGLADRNHDNAMKGPHVVR